MNPALVAWLSAPGCARTFVLESSARFTLPRAVTEPEQLPKWWQATAIESDRTRFEAVGATVDEALQRLGELAELSDRYRR